MRNQQLLCLLERSYGLFAGHTGKIVQEVSERMAALDIVEKGLKRHSRTDEYGCTA